MQLVRRSRFSHAFIALLGATCAWQAQSDSYSYQLVDHPGTADTLVFGVNNKGSVVGNGFDGLNSHPFVYDSRKQMYTAVAPAAGYFDTVVFGINEAGVMVGGVDTSPDGSTSSGFIRSKDGTFTVFSHPDAFTFTQPRGISSKGLVSGFRDVSDGSTVGFIFNPKNGTFVDFIPSRLTIPQGINARGDVVGSAFLEPDAAYPGSPPGLYGWLRKSNGAVSYFRVNDLPTRARGLTDSGLIAGAVTGPAGTAAFVVSLQGLPYESLTVADADLLVFPGNDFTFAGGIGNSGIVVGVTADPSGTSHGFIATKAK